MSDELNGDATPKWPKPPPEGVYVWLVEIKKVVFNTENDEKPYMRWHTVVLEGAQKDYPFDFSVYYSVRAAKWCRYALLKFGYPKELLDTDNPVLRKREIEGKRGKVLVE